MKSLKDLFGINNLVDDTGDVVSTDFENQADICEIVRAAIAAGKFKGRTELIDIPISVIDEIDCAGHET